MVEKKISARFIPDFSPGTCRNPIIISDGMKLSSRNAAVMRMKASLLGDVHMSVVKATF